MSDKITDLNNSLMTAWTNGIGPVKIPHCSICNTYVESTKLIPNIENHEFIIEATCHGDTCRLHIPLWYAGLIEHRLDVNQVLSTNPDKRPQWAFPPFFDQANTTRIDGILHFDVEQLIAESFSKTPEGKRLMAEMEAKQQFQEEWMHAAKTQHIHEVEAPSATEQ